MKEDPRHQNVTTETTNMTSKRHKQIVPEEGEETYVNDKLNKGNSNIYLVGE